MQNAEDNGGGSATPAVTFGASVATTNPTVVAAVHDNNPPALTPPTGWTEDATHGEDGHATPNAGLETAYRNSGFTGTIITWGSDYSTAAGGAALALELNASAGCSSTPVITDVDTDEILTATQADFTITGTGFCTPQGTGTVTLRQNGNSKTISGCAWSDTSLTGCDMSGAGMGVASGLLYGAADIRVTNDAANFDDQAITITVPSGTVETDLGTPVALTFDAYGNESRLHGGTAAADPTSNSFCARRNLSGVTAVTINTDGSVQTTGTGTFDVDCTDDIGSAGSQLYVGSYAAHPNCLAGSTVVCNKSVRGTPPLFGPTPITKHVLAVNLAMTAYDVDNYFVAGEGAASARALRKLGATTDTTADLSGAHTDAIELTVTNAVAHASLVKGNWLLIGAAGAPVRIKYVNPVNNKIGLYAIRSGSNLDAISTYATGALAVTGVTVNSGTGDVSGTPTVDQTDAGAFYRWTDAAGLIAENNAAFEIDVVTIPDVTANNLATATGTLEALGISVNPSFQPSALEALNEVLAQNSSSFLWGTTVTLTVSAGQIVTQANGQSFDQTGRLLTEFLTDAQAVPVSAVFISGIAFNRVSGARYVALWPADGQVNYISGAAIRDDGAAVIKQCAVRVHHGIFGYTDRGELCVTESVPTNHAQAFGFVGDLLAVTNAN